MDSFVVVLGGHFPGSIILQLSEIADSMGHRLKWCTDAGQLSALLQSPNEELWIPAVLYDRGEAENVEHSLRKLSKRFSTASLLPCSVEDAAPVLGGASEHLSLFPRPDLPTEVQQMFRSAFKNLYRKMSVPELAKATACSSRKLQALTTRALGKPVGALVTELKMRQVRRLLTETVLSNGALAKVVRFEEKYLSEWFRKYARITTRDYRKILETLKR